MATTITREWTNKSPAVAHDWASRSDAFTTTDEEAKKEFWQPGGNFYIYLRVT